METVEVVIRIPIDEFEMLTQEISVPNEYKIVRLFKKVLKNGTVLPKEHGALKDADKIIIENSVDMWTDNGYEPMVAVEAINNSPTVIEADKDGQDEEKPNMMQQTMDFFKNLYLQNKDEIDKVAKEYEADKEVENG